MLRGYLLHSLMNLKKVHPKPNLRNLLRFKLLRMLKQIRSKELRKSLKGQLKRSLKVKLSSKNLNNNK